MTTRQKMFTTAAILIVCVWSLASFDFLAPATAVSQPVKGGTLRGVRDNFPKVLGYPPEMSPTDTIFALPAVERLTNWDEKGNMVPELAESWSEDPQKKTITFHIRKGVKFHDGSPLNAEAVRWNLQMRLDKGRLTDGKYIKSMEVLDEHTLRIHVTSFNNLLAFDYGWQQMFSQKAFETNGIEWVRKNAIGTGPFKLVDFKRDVSVRYERNNDYWRKGTPYLDGIEVRYIPDVMTASAMMQAKEADVWMDVRAVQNVLDLEKKGLKLNWGPGMFWALLPNSNDVKSPYANKKVREAVEYALDRPAIAKMVGLGKFEALHQMAPSNWPGYVQGYNPRPYNPQKAKQLLAEAGYPNGFKTEVLAQVTQQDTAAAIQAYLAAVGIEAKLDIADPGRFNTKVFREGWSHLAFAQSGINPDATDLFSHFGPEPLTYRSGNIKKSPEFLAACDAALHTYNRAEWIGKIKQIVRQGGEDAMVIPVYRSAHALVMQPYVHSEYIKIHTVYWHPYKDWMEKH